jgi:hypothetical protein
MEGGSTITEPNAGITSDMTGRWRINIEKGTPRMKEVVGANEMGAHEIGKFYMKADDSLISKFEDYMKKFEEFKDRKFQDLAMNIVEKFLNIQFQGPLKTNLPIK